MGPLDHLNIAVGNAFAAASDYPLLAQSTAPTRGGTPGSFGNDNAEGAINSLLTGMPWVRPVLSAVGAVMAVYMVVKMVLDSSKGQGGGGGKLGKVAMAAFGLALFFAPGLIASLFDWILAMVASFFTWFGGAFSSSS